MRAERFRIALVSLLVLAAAYGCAGMPQQRPDGGNAAQGPAQTTSSGVSGTTDNRRQGTPGGLMGSGVGFGTRKTDLGRQISNAVARMYGSGNGGTVMGGTNTSRVTGGGAMPGGNANTFRTGNGGAMLGGTTAARPGMRVSTLVMGDIAYIGIDPTTVQEAQQNGAQAGTNATPGTSANPGTNANTGTTPGAGTNASAGTAPAGTSLAEQVRTRVKAMFPQLAEVYVTTDPTLVYRIARVTGDQPELSPQEKVSEMTAIAREMTPAAEAAPAS